MAGADDVRRAKRMLDERGLLGHISARELVAASKEVGKELTETIEFIKRLVRLARGG